MLDRSDQCFLLITGERELSYCDAKSLCRAENASVFTVEVANTSIDKGYTENNLLKRIITFLRTVVSDVSRQMQYYTLLGSPLSKHSPHSQMAGIIIKVASTYGSTIFVDSNGKCRVLEISTVSTAASAEPTASLLRGWGVKCRYCSEHVDVTDVICEKPSEPHTSQCENNHFTCQDKTCILSIYKCDSVYDCFDESDENNCNYEKIYNDFINFANLPCILGDSKTQVEMCTIQIHAVCDGIYLNSTFKKEEIVCYQYTLNNIDLAALVSANLRDAPATRRNLLDNKIDEVYYKERARCSSNLDDANHCDSYSSPYVPRKKELSGISTLCKVSYHSNQPFPNVPQYICQNIACPEMFKCNKYYCIYMSAVCDGQNDCLEGDDEISCPVASCPGLLKCRGEKRCVSKKEICDNHIDCLYSMDDESDCHICPTVCDCNGYSVICTLNNSLEIMVNNRIDHVKGLLLKGLQRELFVHHLRFQGLVYLNVSFCGIANIFYLKNESMVKTYIVIADFKNNYLVSIDFLKASIFSNLIYLELSFNHISVINFAQFFLNNLVVLILKGNPLRDIVINSFNKEINLLWVDIRSIDVYSDLNIKMSKNLLEHATISVSDSILCCMVKSKGCFSNFQKTVCFGLLYNTVSKIVFYCTCIMTLMSTTFILFRRIKDLSLVQKHVNNKRKCYLIALINHSISLLFISLYLMSLLVADTLHVNIFFWRKSMPCIFLNIIIYTSLESLVIFKACLTLILTLQIIYPFRHQCLWLKRTAPLLSVIWLVILSTYFLIFIEQFKSSYTCDSLCSIGMCGVSDTPHILMKMACCIDCIFVAITIFPIVKASMAMKKSKETLNMGQTNQMKTVNHISVIFKVASPIAVELPFRLCLFCLLVTTFSFVNSTAYCRYLFLFALPVNTFCTSLFFWGRK